MANSLTFVSAAEARLVAVLPGAKARLNGVEVTLDGETATRTYNGADNKPAIDAWCSRQMSTKEHSAPQSCRLVAPGIYAVEPFVSAQEALGIADKPARAPKP